MENGDCWKYFRTKSEAKVGIYNFMIQTPATRPHVVEFSLPRGPLPLTFVKEEPGVIVKQEPIEEEEEMKRERTRPQKRTKKLLIKRQMPQLHHHHHFE